MIRNSVCTPLYRIMVSVMDVNPHTIHPKIQVPGSRTLNLEAPNSNLLGIAILQHQSAIKLCLQTSCADDSAKLKLYVAIANLRIAITFSRLLTHHLHVVKQQVDRLPDDFCSMLLSSIA